MKRIVVVALLCLAACVFAQPAPAHATSTSFLEIDTRAAPAPVTLRWDLALHDLVWWVLIDTDFNGVATWQEVEAAARDIERGVLSQLALERGGTPCALTFGHLSPVERLSESFLSVTVTAQCPRAGALAIGGSLYMSGNAGQRVMLTLRRGDETLAGAVSAQSPTWTEPARVSAWSGFARFVGEGVWHVLIGYDHIAFVLLLLLPSVLRAQDGRWRGATRLSQVTRDIVTIVTAFTVAHSVTLALAVTDTVRLPSQPVEIAIAASIAVAALINLLPRLSPLRLPVAFAFGLVHGFGFANVLGELDPGGTGLLALLAGFNVGVELAQLGIVALVLPLIYMARGTRWYAAGVMPLGSCALGAAGLVWLLQRI